MKVPALPGTGLLCLMSFATTVCVGAFGPLLPEIARAQGLPDWQLGVLAAAFGLARMAADLPAGMLATRRLGSTLAAAPVALLAGTLLLVSAGPLPVLILGRLLTGVAQTLVMVGSLTAVLQDHRGPSPAMRLNTLEFSGMLGVLGGLSVVALLPEGWRWNTILLAASAPVVIAMLAALRLRRLFPDHDEPRLPAGPLEPSPRGGGGGRAPALPPLVKLMFAQGAIMALAWSAVSQFVVPLRGTREFGLDRGGISGLLSLSQLMDLLVLLPVGWLADRIGRRPLLIGEALVLGLALGALALGSLPVFTVGCALFGLAMAGWMLPLGMIREHTEAPQLAWRAGAYRMGVDGAMFLGPLVCGIIGEARTSIFVVLVGAASLGIAARVARA
ncbi:MAG TPA: MFS transporter [Candidatus Bathyarchaeia archaeon]|nr:MFS transporter [Candidatus Bathyarchaeia archaeon]